MRTASQDSEDLLERQVRQELVEVQDLQEVMVCQDLLESQDLLGMLDQ